MILISIIQIRVGEHAMTEKEFIEDFVEIRNLTEEQTEGLWDKEESSHEEYIENLEISFVDNYAREKGISWDEANQILLDNIQN